MLFVRRRSKVVARQELTPQLLAEQRMLLVTKTVPQAFCTVTSIYSVPHPFRTASRSIHPVDALGYVLAYVSHPCGRFGLNLGTLEALSLPTPRSSGLNDFTPPGFSPYQIKLFIAAWPYLPRTRGLIPLHHSTGLIAARPSTSH